MGIRKKLSWLNWDRKECYSARQTREWTRKEGMCKSNDRHRNSMKAFMMIVGIWCDCGARYPKRYDYTVFTKPTKGGFIEMHFGCPACKDKLGPEWVEMFKEEDVSGNTDNRGTSTESETIR